VCATAPQPRITVVSPTVPVDGPFELVVEVEFVGDEATLVVERGVSAPGDPCRPFLPRRLVVAGNGGPSTVRVGVPDLPALGPAFAYELRLQVSGFLPALALAPLVGPASPGDSGGAVVRAPVAGDIDVEAAPVADVRAQVDGPAVAYIEDSDGRPATPRVVVAPGAGPGVGQVPLLRGPQTLWVETTVDGAVRRCGVGLRGLPEGDDGGALDVALVATAAVPVWAGLSLRLGEGEGEGSTVCDRRGGRAPPSVSAGPCLARRVADRPALVLSEVLQVAPGDGVVDVAVVPTVTAGPFDAAVRVTLAGRHVGFFGPFTLPGDDGSTWRAGRIVVAGGAVVALLPTDELVFGAPW
jgi:hypothetical protein